MARSTTNRYGILKAAFIAPGLLLLCSVTADAQVPATGFSGLSSDNAKKPIDIESDRLEVDDKQQMAIFIGNVSATQGDYNVRSQRLEVTYERAPAAKPNEKSAPASPKPVKPVKNTDAPASGDPLTSGQIKFIHATGGNVLVTSTKDEQSATGEEAFYDVKGQKITMTAGTGIVTLSQKKNVVEGKKLVIFMDTGRAIMDPNEQHRVKALLVPQKDGDAQINPLTGAKKKPKTADKAPSAPAAKSSWQTQSH